MKRLIVKWDDGYCNISVTHIETESGYTIAYNGNLLVGIFDNGFVNVLYISEKEGAVS